MKEYKKNIKWIIAGIFLLCFTLIAIFLVTDKVHILDNYVYSLIAKWINPNVTKFFKIVTELANPVTMVIVVLVVSYIIGVKQKDKKGVLEFCICIIIIAILNFVLKNIFTRTRPELINIITETGYSFPSGHSTLSMTVYGYIIYYMYTRCSNKALKIISSIALSIIILLVGISRIYLGVHYTSDVLAAFMLSLAYLIIYTHVITTLRNKKSKNVTKM